MADKLKLAQLKGFHQESKLYERPEVAPGTVLPAAFQGERGEYYQKMISSDDSLRTLLQRNKQIVHQNLQRAGNTGVAISYPQAPAAFVQAWHKAINHQIMQDPFALQAVKGASVEEMTHWLTRTPAGRAYHKRLGIKYSPPERIAASVWHEVDEYMPAMSGVREAALKGEADVGYLTALAETRQHPFNIHTTQLGEALAGSNPMSKGADGIIGWWYKWAASVPADRMSRHPLFNQLYEGHARNLASQQIKQFDEMAANGQRSAALKGKIEMRQADEIAETARRLALKDTRNLVFDIAHRSDAAAMLRFMSPFFAATTEAWQRWARIIADRPQTVGYAGIFFNAPASMGWLQDMDGNRIGRDGHVIDPVTGQKRLVPKGQRRIMARVPKFVASGPIGKAFGMDASGNWSISQDSMNMITQGDPFFNPGVGPIVSIPVNEFVKDKPSQAEMARHLGILPFGSTSGSPLFGNTPLGRAADLSMPTTVKNFLTAYDTSDERYQRTKLYLMQKAAFEHATLGKPMPTAREIADRTRNYWLFSATSAFIQPFATAKPDQYQMFRDQYNNLRRKNPLTADEEFLNRYGESYFIFAQATSKNKVGVEATKNAVALAGSTSSCWRRTRSWAPSSSARRAPDPSRRRRTPTSSRIRSRPAGRRCSAPALRRRGDEREPAQAGLGQVHADAERRDSGAAQGGLQLLLGRGRRGLQGQAWRRRQAVRGAAAPRRLGEPLLQRAVGGRLPDLRSEEVRPLDPEPDGGREQRPGQESQPLGPAHPSDLSPGPYGAHAAAGGP